MRYAYISNYVDHTLYGLYINEQQTDGKCIITAGRYIYIYNDHRSVFYFAGDRFDFWYGATYAKTNPLIRMLHAVSTALQLNHSYIFHHQKENESIKHQMCCFIFQFFKARRMMSPSLICALNVYLFIYIYNV